MHLKVVGVSYTDLVDLVLSLIHSKCDPIFLNLADPDQMAQ